MRFPTCALVLAVCATVSCSSAAPPLAEHSEQAVGGCGVERWAVKTGTDPDAAEVDTTPVDTTIAALAGLTPPPKLPADGRVAPTEEQTFRLAGVTLQEFKLENDSDVHLVLSAGGGTMIAEIPSPSCVGPGSSFAQAIAQARAAFTAQYTPTASLQSAGDTVTIVGVGFFDAIHGQTGVADNGIELHPVLGLCFGQGCTVDSGSGGDADAGSSGGAEGGSSGGGAEAGDPGADAGGCAHSECAAGGRLTASCDGCVAQVCASDAYCCRVAWDSTCVQEAGSTCGACGG